MDHTLSLYPRLVFFNNGLGVRTSFPPPEFTFSVVMMLPSDHYDFPGPVNVKGKTEQQIKCEVNEFMKGVR